jgi:glucose 1-dehydrogenase
MNIRLDQKRALVTGGNSGIGEAIALGLADAGAKVAINYVSHPEDAQSLVQRITDRHGDAIALQTDVSDAGAVAKMFGSIDEAWGGIDILINNAGTDGERALGWEADFPAWRKVIEMNLFGAFYCAREALKRIWCLKSQVPCSTSVRCMNKLPDRVTAPIPPARRPSAC